MVLGRTCGKCAFLTAAKEPSLEMENEEKIRLDARRRLEDQLKQYRVQRHKERVNRRICGVHNRIRRKICHLDVE